MFRFEDDAFKEMDKVYYADRSEEIKLNDILTIIKEKRALLNTYYEMNRKLYTGEIIRSKYFQQADESVSQNNRLYANYAKYIVDTLTGYFMGKGVQVSSKDESIKDIIKNLSDDNDTNNEIAKMTALYGHAFDYTFIDTNNELQTTFVHPAEVVMIYSNDIKQEPLAACHFQFISTMADNARKLVGTLYTADYIVRFKEEGNDVQAEEPEMNPFKQIPIVEYIENEERLGAFDAVLPLIAGYSNTLTQKSNDVAYFADALLLLLGISINAETMKDMKENRVLNVPEYNKEMLPDVKFLERPSNDGTQENLLDRLSEDIHIISNVPRLTDEKFGDTSGVAMKYKLWGLETIRSTKERKFRYALKQRFNVYASYLEMVKKQTLDVSLLEFKFFANKPNDLKEDVEIVRNLTGIISHQTQLEQLELVKSVDAELERIKDEQEPEDSQYESIKQ